MKNFVIWIIILMVFLVFFSLFIAILWHNVAFKYMFQFLTSLGFLLIGFYYLLKTRVPGNIEKGILFIILSPIVFYLSNFLFYPIKFTNSKGFLRIVWDDFLDVPLYKIDSNIKVWHILLVLWIFGNAIVLARKPKISVIISVNLLVLVFGFIIYFLFK